MPDTGARGVLVEDVRVALDGAPVLRGVDLRVEPGSHLAILGPSGVRKTTLLRVSPGCSRLTTGACGLATTESPDQAFTSAPSIERWASSFKIGPCSHI